MMDERFKEKELERIHRALGHPSRKILEQLLKDVGSFNESTAPILK